MNKRKQFGLWAWRALWLPFAAVFGTLLYFSILIMRGRKFAREVFYATTEGMHDAHYSWAYRVRWLRMRANDIEKEHSQSDTGATQ